MEYAEELKVTRAPVTRRQNARQDSDESDCDSCTGKLGPINLASSNAARNSSISDIRGSASKDGSLLARLKDSLNLPRYGVHAFERVILTILDQEPVMVDELIHTMTSELSSTEKNRLINLLHHVDIFFNFHLYY